MAIVGREYWNFEDSWLSFQEFLPWLAASATSIHVGEERVFTQTDFAHTQRILVLLRLTKVPTFPSGRGAYES
jgi:hypothetical protein